MTSRCHEKEFETDTRIYSQDIGIEFRKEKYAMLLMKSGKRETTEVIEPPNQKRIRKLEEKEYYKSLRILEADGTKQIEMKEEIRNKKRVPQSNEKTSRNQIPPSEISLKGLTPEQHSRTFLNEQERNLN